ncbi:hypothetical protein [Nocardia nova]|uniref:hypothetical protein n=1 Tax=Nocardia nova TaxID=37330 RepID=UPI0011B0C1A5
MPPEAGHEIVVTGEHFPVIRQLTLQLPNVSSEILERWGWTEGIKSLLKKLARSVPADIEPTRRVRIEITVEDVDDALAADRNLADPAENRSETDILRYLPATVARIWPPLLEEAFQFLGSQEARYRTGFQEGEIRAALDSFTLR